MDITIKCQLSLSKKLRALIQEGEARVVLVAPSIVDGRGTANLVISSDKSLITSLPEFLGKETSIILVPMEFQDITVNPDSVSSIFTKINKTNKTNKTVRSPIEKITNYVDPDEIDNEEMNHAIKTQEEIEEETPETFKVTKNPAFKRYISSIEELNLAIDAAKNKTSDIDLSSYQDVRKRMEMAEAKEKMEGIDLDAFIVNVKCANLAINDLGINLLLNMPYNLSNISAKRISSSRELRSVLNSGWVKFIKPQDIQNYVNLAEKAIEKPTLDVYSSRYEASDNMDRTEGMQVERMDMDISDLDVPTENETILTNLTARPTRPPINNGGVTKTIHGNTTTKTPKMATQEQQKNSKGLKTIRRTGLNY